MLQTPIQETLRGGDFRTAIPAPCSLVIFGGAGDLARRKLIPALWNLHLDKELPSAFAVVGFARTELDDEGYREFARQSIEQHSRRPLDTAAWAQFRESLFWVKGDFDQADAFRQLKSRLDELEHRLGIPGNR